MKRLFLTLWIVTNFAVAGLAWAGQEPCKAELEPCLTEMARKLKAKGWVGIELEHEDDGTLLVERVIPNSPAASAGLRPGDRILALNGVAYSDQNREALKAAYAAMVPENTITYSIERGGKTLDVEIVLGHIPESVRAQWIARHLVEAHAGPAHPEPGAGD